MGVVHSCGGPHPLPPLGSERETQSPPLACRTRQLAEAGQQQDGEGDALHDSATSSSAATRLNFHRTIDLPIRPGHERARDQEEKRPAPPQLNVGTTSHANQTRPPSENIQSKTRFTMPSILHQRHGRGNGEAGSHAGRGNRLPLGQRGDEGLVRRQTPRSNTHRAGQPPSGGKCHHRR